MDTSSTDQALGRRSRGFLVALFTAVFAGLVLAPHPDAARAADEAFPLTVVDDEGTEVSIEALPQRIVSLSPGTTEIVFALGAGDRLVGRTEADDHPPEATDVTPVASYNAVDLERLLAVEPDLVLAGGNSLTQPDDIATMRDLGLPVIVVYAPDVPGVLADIGLIAEAIGMGDAAAELVTELQAQLDTIAEAVSGVAGSPRVFYEIGADTEIYAPAPDSFVADMVALAGGDPITTADPARWSISIEELVVADPEVIVLGDANYGVCPADVAARAGWKGMTAVVEGAVAPVDDVTVTRPGPRLPQGLASLARAIHPGLELAGFPADPPMCEAG
ncbi:MAG: helical backbone metal receptor [Chloroflexota bacterium]|jgi:iron complex transport system substrate-binding protein